MKTNRFLLCLLMVLGCASFAPAALTIQSELAIPYQGRLNRNNTTKSLAESVEMAFYLYATETAEIPVWARSFYVTPNEEGEFTLALSDAAGTDLLKDETKTLARAIGQQDIDEPLWLAVRVSPYGEEWVERQPLHSLPRAHAAIYADSAPKGLKVVGDLTVYTLSAPSIQTNADITATTLTVGDETTLADDTIVTTVSNATVNSALAAPKITCPNSITVQPYATNNDFFPIGSIILWSGASNEIPDGWALCDGKNGRPDLVDRFLIGNADADFQRLGDTFDADFVSLEFENIPAHQHNFRYPTCMETHEYSAWKDIDVNDDRSWVGSSQYDAKTEEGLFPAASEIKAEQITAFSLMPRHYVLCYIQRIK